VTAPRSVGRLQIGGSATKDLEIPPFRHIVGPMYVRTGEGRRSMEDRGGVEHGDYTRLLYTASYIPSMNGHYTELLYTVSIHGDYVR